MIFATSVHLGLVAAVEKARKREPDYFWLGGWIPTAGFEPKPFLDTAMKAEPR